MALKNDIINNWKTDIVGFAHSINSSELKDCSAWTVKFSDSYGVAIPYNGKEEINEYFSNAHLKSGIIAADKNSECRAIILTADFSVARTPFSALCEELISPGSDGKDREAVLESPVAWWKEWKELLGNRNINERVYDTVGELCVLKYLTARGKDASWDGPNAATYDIETPDRYVEVKSTLSRSKKEITVNSQFQLDPPGKRLQLILCQFERSTMSGISIDQAVSDLIALGVDKDYLNSRLARKGLEEGMSARKCTFILHDMLKYEINEDFPRITPASFVDGVVPVGITDITYTVSLDGLQAESIMRGETHDIQNN